MVLTGSFIATRKKQKLSPVISSVHHLTEDFGNDELETEVHEVNQQGQVTRQVVNQVAFFNRVNFYCIFP